MTISSATRKAGPFLGNGVTNTFPFTFKVFSATDLQVIKTSTVGVDSAPLVLNSDYSVSLNADQNATPGGSITYPLSGALLQTNEKLTATGVLAELQNTHITNGGNFFANNIEDQMDYLTILVQQHAEKLARALLASTTDAAPILILGTALQRANTYATFDANGNLVLATSLPSGTLSQASIGQFLFPQTPAEAGASVAPTNSFYSPWRGEDVRRFGATGDGVTNDRAALNTANSIGAALYFPPGTYLINSNITFTVPLILDYGAKLKPANGVTVTLNNDVNAGLWKVFDYSAGGTVAGLKKSWPQWFGAVGDGATSDSAAIGNACTATSGGTVYVPNPAVSYLLTTTITVPDNTAVLGQNKRTCQMKANANVDILSLGDGAQLYGLYVEGNTKTGHGVQIPSGKGNQTIQNCRIVNFDVGTGGGALNFADNTAGSRISVHDLEVWQTNGQSGNAKYAVYIPDVFNGSAVPRKFSQIETAGFCAFFFGGCNDVFISGSFLADLAYSTNSRGVQIGQTRIANQTVLTIDGANHTLIGCDVNPTITLAATLTNSVIGPLSENHAPIVDNTGGNNSVQVFEYRQLYTPTLSSGGTAPFLGNGTLSGFYSRIGSATFVVINFTIGSTTTLGTGDLRFSLPVAKQDGEVVDGGTVVINAGTLYTAASQIPGNVNYVTMIRDTSGSVTFNSPAALAAGHTIRLSLVYEP